MSLTLDAARVDNLCSFVDARVRREGCDHTHRFTQEWAGRESVDWHDLLDVLEANAVFCDCEVVLNLPHRDVLEQPQVAKRPEDGSPWLLPPGFECPESKVFTKVIVCRASVARYTYAADGELLVPAPRGATPRRRVRKSVNFFIGVQSGLPSEVGVVQECDATSATDFARQVAGCGSEELADFTSREAAFVLSRVAALPPSTTVGTDYADRVGVASRHEELTIHRVIVRRAVG